MKVLVERRVVVTDTVEIDDKYAANLHRTNELWHKGEMRWTDAEKKEYDQLQTQLLEAILGDYTPEQRGQITKIYSGNCSLSEN